MLWLIIHRNCKTHEPVRVQSRFGERKALALTKPAGRFGPDVYLTVRRASAREAETMIAEIGPWLTIESPV